MSMGYPQQLFLILRPHKTIQDLFLSYTLQKDGLIFLRLFKAGYNIEKNITEGLRGNIYNFLSSLKNFLLL